jgi:hypothetical protein
MCRLRVSLQLTGWQASLYSARRNLRELVMAQYQGYCVKCRDKRDFDGQEVTMKNGRRAAKGKCPVCGTTVMRMLGK